jgi:6-phosphogluconolactonase (cycloisomerase 2 family)
VLLDHRTYRVKPGTLQAHLALYEKHGLGPQTRHLGQPFAYLVTETGELNTYVHIWAYEDAADRTKKRAAMMADAEWKEYLRLNGEAGYLLHQENKLMIPTAFAPIKR